MNRDKALAILELTAPCSQESVRRSFRSLAFRYHPDLFEGSEEQLKAAEKFRLLKEAYDFLSGLSEQELNNPSYSNTDYQEHTLHPNPERGRVHIPDWAFLADLEKGFSFYLLFDKKARFWQGMGKLIQKLLGAGRRPYESGKALWLWKLGNLFRLLRATCISALVFLSFFLLSTVLIISAIAFIPAYWAYRKLGKLLAWPFSLISRALLLVTLLSMGILFISKLTPFSSLWTWIQLLAALCFIAFNFILAAALGFDYHKWRLIREWKKRMGDDG